MPAPTAAEVAAYLGESSYTEDQLTAALAAESAAQAARCRVPAADAEWPADLAEALMRRVATNLARRNLPLAVLQGDAETGATILPGSDPEVRRLEAPHRRVTVG